MPPIELTFLMLLVVVVLVLILLMLIAVHTKVEESRRAVAESHLKLIEAKLDRQEVYLVALLNVAVDGKKNLGPLN